MKHVIRLAVLALCAAALYVIAQPKPKAYEPHDPIRGLVYFKNPTTGKLALYVAYELEVNRLYRFDVTEDGVNFETIEVLSTKGNTHEIYESFNIPNPCDGIWPRIVDLGPSQ